MFKLLGFGFFFEKVYYLVYIKFNIIINVSICMIIRFYFIMFVISIYFVIIDN